MRREQEAAVEALKKKQEDDKFQDKVFTSAHLSKKKKKFLSATIREKENVKTF